MIASFDSLAALMSLWGANPLPDDAPATGGGDPASGSFLSLLGQWTAPDDNMGDGITEPRDGADVETQSLQDEVADAGGAAGGPSSLVILSPPVSSVQAEATTTISAPTEGARDAGPSVVQTNQTQPAPMVPVTLPGDTPAAADNLSPTFAGETSDAGPKGFITAMSQIAPVGVENETLPTPPAPSSAPVAASVETLPKTSAQTSAHTSAQTPAVIPAPTSAQAGASPAASSTMVNADVAASGDPVAAASEPRMGGLGAAPNSLFATQSPVGHPIAVPRPVAPVDTPITPPAISPAANTSPVATVAPPPTDLIQTSLGSTNIPSATEGRTPQLFQTSNNLMAPAATTSSSAPAPDTATVASAPEPTPAVPLVRVQSAIDMSAPVGSGRVADLAELTPPTGTATQALPTTATESGRRLQLLRDAGATPRGAAAVDARGLVSLSATDGEPMWSDADSPLASEVFETETERLESFDDTLGIQGQATPDLAATAAAPTTVGHEAKESANHVPVEATLAPALAELPTSINPTAMVASPPTATMPAVGPDSLGADVMRAVAEAVNDQARQALVSTLGVSRAVVAVDPPHLGEVLIEVTVDAADRLRVQLQPTHEAAREILEGETDEIIDSLVKRAFEVAEVTVKGAPSDTATGDSGRGSRYEKQNHDGGFSRESRRDETPAEDEPRRRNPGARPGRAGRLDLQA